MGAGLALEGFLEVVGQHFGEAWRKGQGKKAWGRRAQASPRLAAWFPAPAWERDHRGGGNCSRCLQGVWAMGEAGSHTPLLGAASRRGLPGGCQLTQPGFPAPETWVLTPPGPGGLWADVAHVGSSHHTLTHKGTTVRRGVETGYHVTRGAGSWVNLGSGGTEAGGVPSVYLEAPLQPVGYVPSSSCEAAWGSSGDSRGVAAHLAPQPSPLRPSRTCHREAHFPGSTPWDVIASSLVAPEDRA